MQLIELTNSHDAQASLDTPTDAFAAMVAHRLLPSAMRSNDDSDRPVNSLMLSLRDLRGLPLRRLPSTVPCSMILAAYRDGRHVRTTIDCDA